MRSCLFLIEYGFIFEFIFQVNFSSDTYFENVLDNIQSIAWSNSKKLREAVDKTEYIYLYITLSISLKVFCDSKINLANLSTFLRTECCLF